MPRTLVTKDNAAIGKRLRARREALGLSQRELAKRVGDTLTAAYISRLEAGARQASFDALRLLAEALDVDPNWLESGGDRVHESLPRGDALLAVWFTPDAIRSHYDGAGGYSEELAELVAGMDDEKLREVGGWCIESDSIWKLYGELLDEVVSGYLPVVVS